MSGARGAAERWRGRMVLRSFLGAAGRAMGIGAGVGLLLVVADRTAPPWMISERGVPWWALLAAPVLVAASGAMGYAFHRRPTVLGAAIDLDRTLGLKGLVSSALALQGRRDPFVDTAVRDAEAAAPGIDPARAMPLRFGGAWWGPPVLVAAGVAAGLWLPPLRWGEGHRGGVEATRAALPPLEAVRLADRAGEVSRVSRAAGAGARDASARDLAALDEVERELREGRTPTPERLALAGRAVAEEADRAAAAAERERAVSEAARDALGGAGVEGVEHGAPQSALERALRSGDLRAAREAAEGMLARPSPMTAAERESLAETLESMAREPEPSGEAQARREPEAAPERRVSPPLGTEHEPRSGTPPTAGEREKAPSAAPSNPGQAETPAPDGAGATGRDPAGEPEAQARREVGELKESMRRAAGALRGEQPRPNASDRPSKGEPSPGNERKPGQPEPEPGKSAGGDEGTKPGGSPGEAAGERAAQDGAKRNGTGGGPRPGEGARAPREGDTSKSPAEGDAPGRAGANEPGGTEPKGTSGDAKGSAGAAAPAGTPKGEPKPGGTPPTARPAPSGDRVGASGEPKPAPGSAPGGERGGARAQGAPRPRTGAGRPETEPDAKGPDGDAGGSTPEPGQGPPPVVDGSPSSGAASKPDAPPDPRLVDLAERLSRMEDAPRRARAERERAEDLHDLARRLAEGADPGARERLRAWQGQSEEKESQKEPHGESAGGDEPSWRVGPAGNTREPGGGAVRAADAPPASNPRDEFGTRPMDIRRSPSPGAGGDRERTIAEWFRGTDDAAGRTGAGGGGGGGRVGGVGTGTAPLTPAEIRGGLDRAGRDAERAIEERVVPGRYDGLLRRYFRRLPDAVAPAPAAPRATPAKDAG